MTAANARKSAYAVLFFLFIGCIAFQWVISAEALRHIWSESRQFRPEMLTGWDLEFFGHVLAPFACLLLAFYAAGVRVWDARAWLLLAVLISFSIQADGLNVRDEVMQWSTPLKHLALAYRSLGAYTFPFWLVLFAIYFPEQTEWGQRHSKVKWLVLVIAALNAWAGVLRILANETKPERWAELRDVAGAYWTGAFYFAVIFFLVLLAIKLRIARTRDSRRRVRVLLFGIALTLVPLTSLSAIARIRHIREDDLPAWLLVPLFPLVLTFPITVAYVTVVQRALDLHVAIRQSLQYALARRGVVLLQILVSFVVILGVAGIAGEVSFFERLFITAAGVAAVLLAGVGANRLGLWIDRRFFREAYNAEQVLNRLAETVSSMVELGPLLKTVTTRIAEALHISEIAVFLCEQKLYRPAFSLGYTPAQETAFADNSHVVQELNRQREALPVYIDDPRSWASRVDGAEAKLLRELQAQLLLPLARKNELLGFITLGPKHAEAPYSNSDVNLLQAVASQTALAVENSRLTSTIATETAEREVIQRELAIAREVQQRLFPQSYPAIPGVEYYATCRPAREVGGDYYDFIELPSQRLGLAIGDVSGKGIPASLLMASLQASLRGQSIAGTISMERLMLNINRLIYAATPVNRYATFFYAQYDPVTRRLVYVNAGHNAPMVFRKQQCDRSCIRLETGGPPVGLLPEAPYMSAEIQLQAEDLLVLFTDGMSETMNVQEDEWGEAGLMDAVAKSAPKDPREIVTDVFEAADRFASGAPQHDDMTIVVFRVRDAGFSASRSQTVPA